MYKAWRAYRMQFFFALANRKLIIHFDVLFLKCIIKWIYSSFMIAVVGNIKDQIVNKLSCTIMHWHCAKKTVSERLRMCGKNKISIQPYMHKKDQE